MDPIAISVEEARKSLGIGRTKLYELVGQGRLKALKIGRRTLILVASIHALINDAS
jgi:excisionase family DNA binding protein